MKKIHKSIVLLIISIVFIISSCGLNSEDPEEEKHMTELYNYTPKDGIPDQSVFPTMNYQKMPEDPETSFDQIDIQFEKDVFEHEERIKITVINNNKKEFYLLKYPYVEFYDKTKCEWMRLVYTPPELYQESGFCEGGYFYAIYFDPHYLVYPYESGKYRFIVFCTDNPVYSQEITIS